MPVSLPAAHHDESLLHELQLGDELLLLQLQLVQGWRGLGPVRLQQVGLLHEVHLQLLLHQSEVSIGSSINQSQLTWSWGTSCSSCLRPASAPCWTSCCSCAGWRLEKGELCTNQRRVLSAINQSQLTCSSWCICCSPGGSRGSCSAGAGDTRPDSESLQQKIFYRI